MSPSPPVPDPPTIPPACVTQQLADDPPLETATYSASPVAAPRSVAASLPFPRYSSSAAYFMLLTPSLLLYVVGLCTVAVS